MMMCEAKEITRDTNSKRMFRLNYGGNHMVAKVRDYLYRDSDPSIRLERKLRIVETLESQRPPTKTDHIWIALLAGNETIADIFSHCKTTTTSITPNNISRECSELVQQKKLSRYGIGCYRINT